MPLIRASADVEGISGWECGTSRVTYMSSQRTCRRRAHSTYILDTNDGHIAEMASETGTRRAGRTSATRVAKQIWDTQLHQQGVPHA
jgi:hypothetical protein